jgi:hypothetical protein
MQGRVYIETLDMLNIAPRNLAIYSFISMLIYLADLNYISNIVTNVFDGGIIAALLCSLIPLGKK